MPGFLPYIRMPVLKIFAAAQITRTTATAKTSIETAISTNHTPEPADNRNTITIGVTGGTNDNTFARVPLGLWTSLNQPINGIMKINITGIIRLWVSFMVLQIEPMPVRIALKRR